MASPTNLLLDERHRPLVRDIIGSLLSASVQADFAVARIRLAAIDLAPAETGHVRRCRILLGRLDYGELTQFGAGDRAQRRLSTLLAFLTSGRVEIRSAGMAEWLPDFSVFRGMEPADDGDGSLQHSTACLMGAHFFSTPPVDGPALTCIIRHAPSVAKAARRYDELWAHGHDVLPAVLDTIAAMAEHRTGP
ncbi:MAG TPA: hypothetical protein VK929_06510 [Longimicrobiales bacterium]|nr:hypothetical protein [Longimicrobiales bacterium]